MAEPTDDPIKVLDAWRARNEDTVLIQTAQEAGVSIRMVREAAREVREYLLAEGISQDEYDTALMQADMQHPVITIRGKSYEPAQLLVERIEKLKMRHVQSTGKTHDSVGYFWTEEADSDVEVVDPDSPLPRPSAEQWREVGY